MKRIMSFLLLATLAVGTISCGQKNKVNSSQLSSTGSTVFTSGITYSNSNTSTALSSYLSSYSCQSGQRHASALFYLSSAYSTTSIGGTFTKGTLSGTQGTTYVGRSAYNDIMIVTKVLNSSGGVMGFNVEVAYCVDTNNSYTPPAFYNRGISAFAAPYYITLTEPTTSSIGRLYSSQTVAYVDPYQGSCTVGYQSYSNCNLPQFYLYTSFGQ